MPKYGELMTVEEFRKAVEGGAYIDYDGRANPAKLAVATDVYVRPSKLWEELPKDATHVVWYNK